jgi:2-methylcitrate dehydratase PrpD
VSEEDALPELVRAVTALSLDEVPPPVREHAARVLADTLGVIMAGALRPEIEALVAGDGDLFSPISGGPSQILRPGLPGSSPAAAAFVNGTAGTFLELDEGYRPTGHPAIHVLPAALAAAQALHRPGSDLLAAFLAGYEVTARLFEAYRLTYPLHPHGHFGAVGAAVAVARLRGADPAEPAAIAATLPLLSVWQPCYEGATARNAYAGTAAAIGVMANRMAVAGFTGSRQAQPVAFGDLVGHVHDRAALTASIDPERPRILNDYLKLHSACALSHTALDAVLQLAPAAAEVTAVEIETVANSMKLDRQAAGNDLSARFSLPYAVAAAIVHGHTRPEAFRPDPRVTELAARVTVRHDRALEAGWPESSPARVTVHASGRTLVSQVDNARGHHANPASPVELRAKFEMLCWLPAPGAAWERLLSIESVADCAELFG